MLPKEKKSALDMFRSRLVNILSHDHPLYKLAGKIDWSAFVVAFGAIYCPDDGREAKPIRLLVGLHYLKHAYDQSDESVVARWLENPYWQYFCGMEYFQHELPCHPTLLVKWRHRVGAERLEKLLAETIDCARRERCLDDPDLSCVTVDTTVQEKAIAFPTDARLYNKCRLRLVKAAKRRGLRLRQSFAHKAKEALLQQHRYASAGQFKRAAKMTRRLKTYLGRVVRDIERKADPSDPTLSEQLEQARRLLSQRRGDKNKLYSLHAPEVECIAKGKAHKKYEFGCKVGVVTTTERNWMVGIEAFHGNPYDGHTLEGSLKSMRRVTGVQPRIANCDKGYRGHGYEGETVIHVAGGRRGRGTFLSRLLYKRRSAIEPMIGHLKSDHRMERNHLKGKQGDKINAVLAAAGYNLRKLLRAFFFLFWKRLLEAISSLFSIPEGMLCPSYAS
jgi:IS5 family transposase